MTFWQTSGIQRPLATLATLLVASCGSIAVGDQTGGQLAGDAVGDAMSPDLANRTPDSAAAETAADAAGSDGVGPDASAQEVSDATAADSAPDAEDAAAVDASAEVATNDTAADAAPDAGADAGAACKPTAPPAEVCDGVDNDCDGSTDQAPAGAPNLCEDGNPCTQGEACAGGSCKGGALKACDDGNACTSDFCKDGACSYTAIADCGAPIDPMVGALTFNAAALEVPGSLLGTLTIKNLGKQIIVVGPNRLGFDIAISADATWDAGDLVLASQDWTGYAVGSAKPQDALAFGLTIDDLSKLSPGAQFACVHLKNGGDTNPANNSACAKITLNFPQYKIVSYTLPSGEVFAGSDILHQLKVTNLGGQALKPVVNYFLSADGVLDAKDVALAAVNGQTAFVIGELAPGASVTHAPSLLLPADAVAGKPWACAVVNQALAAKEVDAKDNVLCSQFAKLRNPSDLAISASSIMFRSANGSYTANPAFGGDYTCHLTQIANASYQLAKAPVAVRCWVDSAGKAYPGDGNWPLDWKTAADVPAGHWQNNGLVPGKLENAFSVGISAKLRPPQVGATYLCAHLNHDGAVDEIALGNNQVCGKITIFGYDLYVDLALTKLGGPAGSPQVTSLTRGTPLAMQMRICNKGNQTIYNPGNLKTRILLSSDDKVSADDSVVFKESGLFGYSQIDAVSPLAGPGCVNMFTTKKLTLPLTLPTGNFFLLFDVNYDMTYLEPDGNNAAIGGSVTVN
jgi:hypothetical protein